MSEFLSDGQGPVVLLVGTDVSPGSALQEAAEVLTAFDLPFARCLDGEADAQSAQAQSILAGAHLRAVIVAAPDGELPGRWAQATPLPVLRVPVPGGGKQEGLFLLQDGAGDLPCGAEGGEFGTLAIGSAGGKNAALFVVAILAVSDEGLRRRWEEFRAAQTAAVREGPALRLAD